jgi:AbrB family looped-hinge helix DNA binding protein
MITLTVTAKGQVTLRKEILEHLGIKPGSKVVVERLDGGEVRLAADRPNDISRVFGMLKGKSRVKLTIAQMNKIIADGWAGKLEDNPRHKRLGARSHGRRSVAERARQK